MDPTFIKSIITSDVISVYECAAFSHDNASMVMIDFLAKRETRVMWTEQYLLNLPLCDFNLFSKLKNSIGERVMCQLKPLKVIR